VLDIKTDTAKYCFTEVEMNYWIGAAYDSHTYRDIMDSIKTVNKRCEDKIAAKDYELRVAQVTMKVKDTLINAQKLETETLKTELKYERKWKSLWKNSTGIIGGASLLFFGYKEIKE